MALLDKVYDIARQAGAAIMEIYVRDYSVGKKKDNSPVTEADIAAHELIVQRLGQLQLVLPILSEEGIVDSSKADGLGSYWIVDPLDGTKEFMKGNDEFTVNIALIERGRPILGVVYAPALHLAYLAAEGVGVFKLVADRMYVSIRVAKHVTGTPWRVIGSRSHAGDSLALLLQKLGSYELISMGSSLKFCLVAEGRADVYPRLGPTSLWDTAAAQCVVEQAGGSVLQLTGEPIIYADPPVILNPFFVVHGISAINWPDTILDAIKTQPRPS